ncbi:hypothetical protein MNBD_GAMMA19-86, partial [hydrothermal vent metagenome]
MDNVLNKISESVDVSENENQEPMATVM